MNLKSQSIKCRGASIVLDLRLLVSWRDGDFALFWAVSGGAGDWHSELLRDGLLFLGSTKQVRGASIVNLKIALDAGLVSGRYVASVMREWKTC